jgi:hypothetical protein
MAGEILADLHLRLNDCVPVGHNPGGFIGQTEERGRNLEWYFQKFKINQEQI